MDYELPMTEYIRPNGTKVERSIECDEQTYRKYEKMKEAGFFLAIEYIGLAYALYISDENDDYHTAILTGDGNRHTINLVNEFNIEQALVRRAELSKEA
jgi:hypothetical protein